MVAIDAEADGIARVLARMSPEELPRLRVEVGGIEEVAVPEVDLVWAGYSLFFLTPQRFPAVWQRIREAVRPGGRFAGQLLGARDTWATDDEVNAHSRPEAERLFDGWSIERFEEEENDGEALSGPKHWHLFHVVARAPDAPERAL